MLSITSSAAMARVLASPIDLCLRRILVLRRAQLTDSGDIAHVAHFHVVECEDSTDTIEAVVGYPVVSAPSFEWVADHGGWYEAVTIFDDDGFAIVLLVPDAQGIDSELIALCREQATAPPPYAQADDQEGQPHQP